MPELIEQITMNLHDGRLDSETMATSCHENWLFKVRCLATSLCINANQAELLPNFVQHDVNTEVHMDRDAAVQGLAHKILDLFNRDSVDLVVNIDALEVLAVALDSINQVTDIVVAIKFDVRVVDLLLMHDTFDHFIIDFRQRHVRREDNTTSLLRLDHDVWLLFVHSDASVFHFAR